MSLQSVMNIANVLTFARMVLVPVFTVLFVHERYDAALLAFVAAAATDALDGFVARRYHSASSTGAVLDPVADKSLNMAAYISLGIKGWVPVFLSVLVVAREVLVLTILGFLLLRRRGRGFGDLPGVSLAGKVTTALQMTTVIVAILLGEASGTAFSALVAVTALSTAYSGYDYITKGFKIFSGW